MKKGFVYQRGDSPNWWVGYFDETGLRRQVSSGSPDKAFAQRLLASLERKVAAARAAGISTGPLTVERFAARWLEDRELREIDSVDDDRRWLSHAMPVKCGDEPEVPLGKMPLDAVKRSDIRTVMARIKKAGALAPRSQLHIYGVLRVMFNDALADGKISTSPCTLMSRRKELVLKRDADPDWRDNAVYDRGEVEQLISDPRIPWDRRTIYACLLLGGMRIGELAARTWADWDDKAAPLTCLSCKTSYNRKKDRVKSTKTDRPRFIPVHPVLADLLSAWRERGWRAQFGRAPEPKDLIIPSRRGLHLRDPVVHERLQADLALLGLRGRRTHDTRRTFISLGQADGADRDMLRWVTHGPPGDIVGSYTSLPWDALCREVAKLRILVTPELHPPPGHEKAPKSQGLGGSFGVPRAGFEPGHADLLGAPPDAPGSHLPLERGAQSTQRPPEEATPRNNVTSPDDPGGYEALARRQGFYVSPPPSQIH